MVKSNSYQSSLCEPLVFPPKENEKQCQLKQNVGFVQTKFDFKQNLKEVGHSEKSAASISTQENSPTSFALKEEQEDPAAAPKSFITKRGKKATTLNKYTSDAIIKYEGLHKQIKEAKDQNNTE